jgi:hypothetical protein
MTISSEAWHQIPLRGTLVSNTLIDASQVDEPIDHVVADIFGNNNTTSTAAVIIEATCIRFPTRVSDIACTRRAQERSRNGPLGAPHQFLLLVAKKDEASGCQTNCGDKQEKLDRPSDAFHLLAEQISAPS